MAIALLAFLTIGVWLYTRARRRRGAGVLMPELHGKPELAGEGWETRHPELGLEGQITEMSSTTKPLEADSDAKGPVAELDGGWLGHEASRYRTPSRGRRRER